MRRWNCSRSDLTLNRRRKIKSPWMRRNRKREPTIGSLNTSKFQHESSILRRSRRVLIIRCRILPVGRNLNLRDRTQRHERMSHVTLIPQTWAGNDANLAQAGGGLLIVGVHGVGALQ